MNIAECYTHRIGSGAILEGPDDKRVLLVKVAEKIIIATDYDGEPLNVYQHVSDPNCLTTSELVGILGLSSEIELLEWKVDRYRKEVGKDEIL